MLSKHLDVPIKEMADSQKNNKENEEGNVAGEDLVKEEETKEEKKEEENTKPKEETFNNAKNLPSDPTDVFAQVKLANV